VVETDNGPAYVIAQHPAGLKPAAFHFLEAGPYRLSFRIGLCHALPFRVKDDGAGFQIVSEARGANASCFPATSPTRPAGARSRPLTNCS